MRAVFKTLSLALCVVILVTTLGACASQAPQPAPKAAEAPKTTEAPKTSEAPKPAESAKPAAAQPAQPAKPAADQPAAKPSSGPVTVVHSVIQVAPDIDPASADDTGPMMYVLNVYEALVETEPNGTKIRPLLAKEWTVSPDKLVYTFKLRDDVVFHDGSPFEANAVKLSYDRIKGINKGRAKFMTYVKDYTVKDKSTFEITLKNPYPYFLEVVSRFLIVSAKAINDNKSTEDPWATKWFAANEAGTGPYKMSELAKNSRIVLVKNDKYYRPWEAGTPERVILRQDPEQSTAVLLMQRGEVDMMGGTPVDYADQAAKIPGVKVLKQPRFNVRAIWFNTQRKPFDDPRVRKAIQLAYDYDADIAFSKGSTILPNGPLPKEFPGADPKLPDYKRDLTKAKQLLADAGYPNGGITVNYLGMKGAPWMEFAGNNLQESLKPLGIEVKQQLYPWPQIVEVMKKLETAPDMVYRSAAPTTGDPNSMFLDVYHSSGIGLNNWAFLKDSTIDAMIEKIGTIADDAERTKVLGELQSKVVDGAYAIYVGQVIGTDPMRENLTNVVEEGLNGMIAIRWFYVRKK